MAKTKPARRSTAVAKRLEENLRHAAELAKASHADSTRRFYESDVRCWLAYAEQHGVRPFPIVPAALASYIAEMQLSGLNVRTIRRRCSALAQWHQSQDEVSPTVDPQVKNVMRGLARTHGTPAKRKRALTTDMVAQILEQELPLRDRALFLVGIATGMRRVELATMEWDHIEETEDGWIVTIPTSKTDTKGEGQTVALPFDKSLPDELCPVRTLAKWYEESDNNFVFDCSGKTINRLVKRYVKQIGLDPKEFGAHSFRVGFATEARRAGGTVDDLMRQSRHKSDRVARRYIETIEKATNPAVLGVLQRLKESAEKRQA